MRACFLFLYICRLNLKDFYYEKTHLYYAGIGVDMCLAPSPSS